MKTEVSKIDKLKHKIKQLEEAQNLLDDLSFRLYWATDFSEFDSITEALNEPINAVDNAKDEIDEMLESAEEILEEYKQQLINLEIEATENIPSYCLS